MIFISHRGNMTGPNRDYENSPSYIEKTLENNFDVEVDVWLKGSTLLLGHSYPQYKTDLSFLKNEKIWCHAKSLETLTFLLEEKVNCFWHERDSYTLTSNGWIWTFPSENINKKCILAMPELSSFESSSLMKCSGICSDFISKYYMQLK